MARTSKKSTSKKSASKKTTDKKSTKRKASSATPKQITNGKAAPHAISRQVAAFKITGLVCSADGKPANALVKAFDKDLRSEELLGETVTNAEGRYEISYAPNRFSRAEKNSADLIVRAYNNVQPPSSRPIAFSSIVFNAKPEEIVDLVVGNAEYRGPSEYERVDAELKPLLEGVAPAPTVRPAELTNEDVAFLAGETGINAQYISFFASAAKLSQQVTKPGEQAKLAPQIFYGFARENLPTELNALLAHSKQVLRRALEDAIRDNIIPDSFKAGIDQTLEQLQQLTVEQAFATATTGKASLGDLLKTSSIPEGKLKEFVAAQIKHEGTPEEFWKNLRANPSLAGLVDDLQFTLQVGEMTRNYLPMAQQIQSLKRGNTIKTLRDLANRDVNEWKQLINTQVTRGMTVGFPPDTPGKDNPEKIDNYARSLTRFIEDKFPTEMIAARLDRDKVPGRTEVAAFLKANPNFDFKTARVDKVLPPNNQPNARQSPLALQLKSMQRVFNLTPRYSEMRALMDGGHESAQSVARMGESAFVAQYGNSLGADQARAVYNRAAQVSATALQLMANYGAAFNKVSFNVLTKTEQLKDIPDWQTLFGSLELCECEHCRSVYSPAAYLVDALSFLKNRKASATNAKPVKDLLFARRPDIGAIELTCDNTNTPMPYVDLVNELLENAVLSVANPAATLNLNRQTRGTAQELAANPQYLVFEAYDYLAKQVYPWTLPFDLWEAEARIYLEQLRVRRHELMRVFQRQNPQPDPAEISIASTYLGLTTAERQILTGQSMLSLYLCWGFLPNEPLSSVITLNTIPEFLRRSGLSYTEMRELIKCRWINYQNKLAVVPIPPAPPDTCELEKQMIDNFDSSCVVRIHRFVRLWRKLGWTMRELDLAFMALKPPSMDKPTTIAPPNASASEVKQNEDFLTQLAQLQQLREEFGVSVSTLLSWYATLDTAVYTDAAGAPLKSLYEQLFQNPTVIKLKPGDTDYFALNSARTELVNNTVLLDANAVITATLRAALGVNDDDLKLLIAAAAKSGKALTLDNLSRMYRAATLARALKLSVADFPRLKDLTGINPFVGDNGAIDMPATRHFIEVVEKIRASGWKIDDLDYLLRHQSARTSTIAPAEASIVKFLKELRAGLRQITQDPTQPDLDQKLVLKVNLLRQKFGEALGLNAEVTNQLLTTLVNAPLAKNEVTPIFNNTVNARIGIIHKPGESDRKPMAVFLDPAFTESDAKDDPTPAKFAKQFRTITLLNKIAAIIKRYQISDAQLGWLFSYAATAGWPDLNTLLVSAPTQITSSLTFGQWERLNDLFALRDSLPDGEAALSEIFKLSSKGQLTAPKLSELTGWNLDELVFLAGASGFNLNLGIFQDERPLTRLQNAFALCQRMGVPARLCRDLAKADLTGDDARNAKQAVRVKYDEAQWLSLAKPLRDKLREQQRAALVSYLVTHPDPSKGWNWKDANDLYAWFLIDVEMSPCQMTSRIKQAISSVQLFVQRCLMNLESGIAVNTEQQPEWTEWRWMKNYRVWEANRKVFLYPENWIEPELRDNKSPFFKELENELLQNEITADTAETALLNYLEKLDAVARLEVCGMYHEEESDADGNKPVDILHIFGRTKGTPHIYYYRRRVDGAYWEPWEQVALDIEGDHLIPVVWNRRLRLCWPIFTEKSEKVTDQSQEPPKYWEVKLAWSEYKNKKWSAKKISSKAVKLSAIKLVEWVTLKGLIIGTDLKIRLYAINEVLLATQGREGNVAPPSFCWPVFEFHFSGCNSDPAVISDGLSNYGPIISPARTGMNRLMFREALGRDGATSQPNELYLLEGNFPLNSSFNDSGVFNNVRRDILTLAETPGTFQLLPPHQDYQFAGQRPFFFQDERKTFLVVPSEERLAPPAGRLRQYLFRNFYHPYLCLFIRELNRYGIDGLFRRSLQTEPQQYLAPPTAFDFNTTYQPKPVVLTPYPIEDVDFSYGGAYSSYNWELFFHAPLLIASRLNQNQRFEDAQKWFHYIFDPTDTSPEAVPNKFWRTRPFFEKTQLDYQKQQIQNLMLALAQGDAELENQVKEWREHPFNPHLIARMRDTAYQKTVVMKYLDNLIGWGDQLFRRDTIESINEATQLYILAADILGRRPEKIKPPVAPQVQTYNSLEPKLDDFSNALVQIENVVTVSTANNISSLKTLPLALPSTLYFCIPRNEKMLGYWDTIADRLFKIRHCMNIEGIVRQLPLFEPPIDPALLVKAAAAGLDIGSVLSDITASLPPHYRFNVMSQKATELCGEVKALGGALLSAIEKRDAEALSLLRSRHEINMLKAVRQVKERQIDEAKQTLEGLKKSREVVVQRHNFYSNIAFMNVGETAHLTLAAAGLQLQEVQLGMDIIANVLFGFPDVKIGTPTTIGATFGGQNLGNAMAAFRGYIGSLIGILNATGSMAATLGGYQRRQDEWKLQEKMAAKELEQMDKQIVASEIRQSIAERELENHDLQVENTKEVDEFMRSKFTNRELYDWMVSQISGIYFQSYQMAYDVAKRAEKSYRHELGLEAAETSFIQFGYWDSLKKGLLAGERLYHDIKRMEVAYLDQNKREYEITKHISLQQLDPIALISLRQTGNCNVSIPESLFDLDCPGHYMRRIKSVSVTIPCITGPYTGVNCTLTLHKSTIRKSGKLLDKYERDPNTDGRFTDNVTAIQSIVTSSAQNDSGLFEANLRDERYLPFEGAGVISDWRIEMSGKWKDSAGNSVEIEQFDFDTISDVVLHFRYTALESSELKGPAVTSLKTRIENAEAAGSRRLLSVRHEFPSEWARFKGASIGGINKTAELTITLLEEHYPFWNKGRLGSLKELEIFAEDAKNNVELSDKPDPSDATAMKETLEEDLNWTGIQRKKLEKIKLPMPTGKFTLYLNDNSMEDIWLLLIWKK